MAYGRECSDISRDRMDSYEPANREPANKDKSRLRLAQSLTCLEGIRRKTMLALAIAALSLSALAIAALSSSVSSAENRLEPGNSRQNETNNAESPETDDTSPPPNGTFFKNQG
jgi:hypothetical protein